MEPITYVLFAVAGFGAGVINAAVGSGTLLTYPALVAAGVPPVTANGTNTVAMSVGNLSAAWAYRRELADRFRLLAVPMVASVAAAALGASLVVALPPTVFVTIVPWLVGLATVLVAVQPLTARRLAARRAEHGRVWPWTAAVGVYGGYFGAAQGVMLMAVLGLFYDSDVHRANAAKNLLAATANLTAGLVFALTGAVDWLIAVVIALGSVPGGLAGGHLARRLPRWVLRILVILVGIGATLYLLLT